MRYATLLLTLALLPAATAQAQDAGDLPVQLVRVLERINSGRHAAGLPPLARDPGLDAAAQAHSQDMASHDMLDHVSPRSGDPAARVEAVGLHVRGLAENIAVEQTALAAHDRLAVSDEHRANMLGRTTTDVGLGAARGPRGVYLTELFAEVLPAASPTPPAPIPTPSPVLGAPLPATPTAPTNVAPGTPNAATNVAPGAPPATNPQPLPRPVIAPMPATTAPSDTPQTAVAVQGGSVDGRRVVGYWVYSRGRWFYYPLPAGAQPGQLLAAAPMPPGVGPDTYAAPSPVPVPAPYVYSAPYMAPPGGVYVMPGARQHFRRW